MIMLISTIHVVVCLFLIGVVLLQQGKGADLSVFGGGGTQAAFGARGAATLLHKLTVIGFIGFTITTMAIGLLRSSSSGSSVITDTPAITETAEEAVDGLEAAPAMIDEAATDAGAAVDQAVEGAEGAITEAMADEAATEGGSDGSEDDQ